MKIQHEPSLDSPLKTIAEAHKYLKVSRARLYQLLPQLECIRIGGRRLVLQSSLDEFIQRLRVAA